MIYTPTVETVPGAIRAAATPPTEAVLAHLQATLVPDPAGRVSLRELHEHHAAWALASGYVPLTKRLIGQHVHATRIQIRDVTYLQGLRLVPAGT